MKSLQQTAVATTSEARSQLPAYLDQFRKSGVEAAPIYLGAYRQPEGVLLSYQAFQFLQERLEDLEIAAEAQIRLSDGTTPVKGTVVDLAERLGLNAPRKDAT